MREFLARNEVPHAFVNVRAHPIGAAEALAIIRRHTEAAVKRGKSVVRVPIAGAEDDALLQLFLGREGFLRAPTLSNGTLLLAGFDEATLRELTGH